MESERSSEEPRLRFADAVSARPDPIEAGTQAASLLAERLGNRADLVIGFVTPPFAQRVGMIADSIRAKLPSTHLMLMTASSVMGGDTELGPQAAVALFGASMPGVTLHPFWIDSTSLTATGPDQAGQLADIIGATESMRAALMFADPFSVPLVNLVPSLSASRASYADQSGSVHRIGTIIGALLSGATTPGNNTLFLDGLVRNHGAMGISLSGDIQVDTLVSQGCRPIGTPMVITKARGNLIMELQGVPAVDAVRAMLTSLDEHDRDLLSKGLLLGRVINEGKSVYGRADFLIRNIIGGDEQSGAVAVADIVHAGQTVQLHLHDQRTAREDLELLLDAQRLYDPPKGALLVSCTGRTQHFFGEPAHDARTIRHAFTQTPDGANLAKGGHEIGSDSPIPLAGLFASGEIGPVGDEIFHHGHTAVAAIFREPESLDL